MHQNVRQRAPFLQNQANATLASHVRPVLHHTTGSREKTKHEVQQNEEERMKHLHARLNQEAEKIRKWKVQTEVELKMKDQKITEAHHTIEKLRKSSLELQLQNENLSQKLEEEMKNKEEIAHRIKATRNMCNLLKDYTAKLDDRMQKCEVEKTELKYISKEHSKQFEGLSEKFKKLEVTTTRAHTQLQNELHKEQDEKKRMTTSYQQQLTKAEHDLHELLKKHEAKDQHVTQLAQQLASNKSQIEKLNIEHNNLQQGLAISREEVRLKESSILQIQQELESSKNTAVTLESQLQHTSSRLQDAISTREKAAKNFDETERLYVEMIKKNQNEMEVLQGKFKEETQRSVELEACLNKAQKNIEALKCEKDMLVLERNENQQAFKAVKAEKETLSAQIEDLHRQISNLSDDKHNANSELLEVKLKMQKCQNELEEKTEELQKKKKNLEKSNIDIIHLKEEIGKKTNDLETLQNALKTAVENEKSVAEEMELLKKQLEDESGENKQVVQRTQELMNEKKSLQKDVNKLTKELEKTKKKETEFKTKWEEAKKDNKNLRSTMTELEKQLKEEAEKVEEIRLLETSHKGEITENLSATSAALEESEKKKNQLEDTIKQNREIIESFEKQIEEYRSEAEKAKTDFEAVDKRCEMEIAEMTNVLGNYKKEYDNEFIAKDEQFDKLKQEYEALKLQCAEKNGESEASLASSKADIEQLNKELERVKQTSVELEEKIGLVEDEIKEKDEEIAKLKQEKSQIASRKADELAQLNEQIEKLKIASHPVVIPSTPKMVLNENKVEKLPKKPTTPKILSTPVIRRAQGAKENRTPKLQLPKTPKNSNSPYQLEDPVVKETPVCNRSILKNVGTQSAKKRRVMFAACASGNCSDDGTESDGSSASEAAMEIEMDEIEKRLKNKAVTPMRIKPSPMIKAAKSPTILPKTPLKPVPRGQSGSAKKVSKDQVSTTPKSNTKIKEILSQKTPNFQNSSPEKKSKAPNFKAQANIRKTPIRTVGKFFTASPKERKESKMKALRQQKSTEDFAWFESDSVFGFGPED